MRTTFVFQIHPLSLEKGFELECDGIIREPLRMHRLIEAVLAAAEIGHGTEAEIRIFNTAGEVAEVLELKGPKTRELVHA